MAERRCEKKNVGKAAVPVKEGVWRGGVAWENDLFRTTIFKRGTARLDAARLDAIFV